MDPDGSVTRWLRELNSDDTAVQQLWERYWNRVVGYASHKLGNHPRRIADEEDVAQSALKSFFFGVKHGRFPDLRDRGNLQRLLVVITARKVHQYLKHEHRQKRGGALGFARELLAAEGTLQREPRLQDVIGDEPSPDFAVEIAEQCERLIDMLGDGDLRTLARMKLEGYTNEEIAQHLACSIRTVERRLQLIRKEWTHERNGHD